MNKNSKNNTIYLLRTPCAPKKNVKCGISRHERDIRARDISTAETARKRLGNGSEATLTRKRLKSCCQAAARSVRLQAQPASFGSRQVSSTETLGTTWATSKIAMCCDLGRLRSRLIEIS